MDDRLSGRFLWGDDEPDRLQRVRTGIKSPFPAVSPRERELGKRTRALDPNTARLRAAVGA